MSPAPAERPPWRSMLSLRDPTSVPRDLWRAAWPRKRRGRAARGGRPSRGWRSPSGGCHGRPSRGARHAARSRWSGAAGGATGASAGQPRLPEIWSAPGAQGPLPELADSAAGLGVASLSPTWTVWCAVSRAHKGRRAFCSRSRGGSGAARGGCDGLPADRSGAGACDRRQQDRTSGRRDAAPVRAGH